MHDFYQQPFVISAKVSNNALSFERREKPSLTVPALKKGTIQDVIVGKSVVFEDFDEFGKLHSCTGLEFFVQTSFPKLTTKESDMLDAPSNKMSCSPVYIFDNHNHAFYFWCAELKHGTFHPGAVLIHVDQHKDNRIPESFLLKDDIDDLEKVFNYTNKVLNVGNFIPPAQKTGLIRDVVFLNSQYSLEQFQLEAFKNRDIILDIDLDFFAPEFDYIDHDLKLKVLKEVLQQANMVTVATSPFFIDQSLALKRLGQIFDTATRIL